MANRIKPTSKGRNRGTVTPGSVTPQPRPQPLGGVIPLRGAGPTPIRPFGYRPRGGSIKPFSGGR